MEQLTEKRVVEIVSSLTGINQGKVESKILDMTLLNATTNVDKEVQLPKGRCVRIAAFITGSDPAVPVNISVKATDGTVLVPPTHYKDWVPGNGGYYESRKPVNFVERSVIVYLSSKTALAADFNVQLVFTSEV